MEAQQPQNTGAKGFVFEEVMGEMLGTLKHSFESEGFVITVRNEQEIRDHFQEQSLNGVDHMMEMKRGEEHYLIFFQEKWKLVTNQREASQFLDCCARIRGRMKDFQGTIFRIWVTRTVPTENGAKTLEEGAAYVVQSSTSMSMLALNAGLYVCELLGMRSSSQRMVMTMPNLLAYEVQLEAKTRDLDVKQIGQIPIKASKLKIAVRKNEYP
jgi:hypothetical protein